MAELSLDQITSVVNAIAKREAAQRGLSPDMFQIQLVEGLKNSMYIDMNKGPTILIQLLWPMTGPVLNAHIRAAITRIMKNSRRDMALVPMSFIMNEQERSGRRKQAWKRGNVWEDIEDRVRGLLPRERVQVEFRSVTIYRDVVTGTEVERRASYKKMHTKLDNISGWLELSKLVHEQHPESFKDDEPDDALSEPDQEGVDQTSDPNLVGDARSDQISAGSADQRDPVVRDGNGDQPSA